VPSARRTLAKEKRAGAVRGYLEEIQNDSDRGLERWFYTGEITRGLAPSAAAARRGLRAAAAAVR
jgi:hypothetical protein